MPPRRRTPTPIPIDVQAIRRKLAEGKIVRVGISRSAQFPEGGTGRVRHVGDPEVDGEEFVQVELSLNGTRDILPFTPADLTPANRTKPAPEPAQPMARPRIPVAAALSTRPLTPAGSAAPPATTPKAVAGHHQPTTAPGGDAAVTHGPAPAGVPEVRSTGPGASDSRAAEQVRPAEPQSGTPSSSRGTGGTAVAPSVATTQRVKGARGARRSPPVSITIATADTEPTQWRIEARVGARVVLRSGSVSPARVWGLVRQLAEPTLITAVGGILEEQRQAAQKRANTLAAELAQVQAELDALPSSNPE